MKAGEFLMMEKDEQENMLHHEGVFIGKIADVNCISMLYQVGSFYVKISYREYRKHVNSIEIFNTPDSLFAYINQVNIDIAIKTIN